MRKTSTIPNYCFDKETGWLIDLPALIEPGTRVLCLYRVSTDGQLYHNSKDEADIPMQKECCREFCEEKGWTIVCELQEEGISGHKVRAENRDKIQLVKEYALQGKFDIFLVFMFDRIGRISDETPFIVEWLVQQAGVRVVSATEGEQRFENHTDKLLNYIRYWQADGESIKTSIRVSNSMSILTKAGCFTGGVCPYGYEFVHTGRLNKKKQPVYDLATNEEEARIVRLVFELAETQGYGAQRIANFLNGEGIKNRSGRNWHPATIQSMLRNILYLGILRSGETFSEKIPELAIVQEKSFKRVHEMLVNRSRKNEFIRANPRNTRGQSLLSGLVYCGHCGAKLCVTTSGKGRKRADGTDTLRMRYTCQTKSRTHGDCDGQTGYTVEKLDRIVEQIIFSLLAKIQSISRSEIINSSLSKEQNNQQILLKKLKSDCEKAEGELQKLRGEVIKAISGESAFAPELLNTLILDKEKELSELQAHRAEAERELAESETRRAAMGEQYSELMEWADGYANSPMSARKVIASHLIDRVDVYRGYRVRIALNISVRQFFEGIAAEAAAETPTELSA